MDMQYQLKAGSYYLYDMREAPSAVTGERRFKLKTDTVAIAFDVHTGKVHQHGSPTRIQSWANNTRRRLRAAGAQQEANDIVVVSGPLPVDELNKCLWVSGYVRRMFSRLATLPHGKLQRPVGRQEQPAPAYRAAQRLRRQHDRLQPQAHRVQPGRQPGGLLST